MIDASIPLGVRPPQIDSPMNALAKVLNIKQAQQGQQMNALKMEQDRRGLDDQNALRQLISGFGTDRGANYQTLLKAGRLKEATEYSTNQDAAEKAQTEAISSNLKLFQSFAPQVKSPQDAAAYTRAMYNHPILGKFAQQMGSLEEAMQRNAEAFQKDPRGWLQASAGVSADKLMEMMKGTRQNINMGGTSQGQTINAYGEVIPGQTTNTPITQSADNLASVAQSDLNSRRTDARGRELNQITREVGLQKKELELGKMQDEATARKQQKQAAVSSVKNQIGVIDKALTHKGRETATGLSGSIDPRNYIAGTDATDFKVVVDQIGGAAFLQAFESLKGGGQITEVEGKKATDAMARLNRAQSDGEFKAALTDLRKVMSDGLSRLSNGSEQVNSVDSLLDKYK